jgi:hypothetical protein
MIETFDTYNKHSIVYKLTEIFAGLLGIQMLFLLVFKNKFPAFVGVRADRIAAWQSPTTREELRNKKT